MPVSPLPVSVGAGAAELLEGLTEAEGVEERGEEGGDEAAVETGGLGWAEELDEPVAALAPFFDCCVVVGL